MYEEYFGLSRRPFSLTPDPAFLYWTDQHRRAFDLVCMSLLRRAPIAVITGEVGTGKTTLLQALIHEISSDFEVGLLSNVVGDSGDLLRWILTAFGHESAPTTHAEAMRDVEALLRRYWEEGRRSVLIIDEAQNVSDSGIETLRLLTNLDVGKCAPLSLVVAGQPELRDRIAGPKYSAFRQRLGASFHLGPMTLGETIGYVRNRIASAGGREDMFSHEAVEAVFRRAQGVPRLTNLLCDLCLVAAFVDERQEVDGELAESALAESLALGGLGGLPAEAADAHAKVMMRQAGAPRAVRTVQTQPRAQTADAGPSFGAGPFGGARPSAPPALRVVAGSTDRADEALPVAPPPLRLTERAVPVSLAEAATSEPAPNVSVEKAGSRAGHIFRQALGSVAGLAVAASLAGVALILPASGTDGGQVPLAEAALLSGHFGAQGTAAVAPATAEGTLGVVELRLAPRDPKGAGPLFERALEKANVNASSAAIDYARAATRGHGRAAYYLAQMYETGDGLPFAPATAWTWYAAATDEVPAAADHLDDLASLGAAADSFATPVFSAVEGQIVELVWQGQGSFVVELAAHPGDTMQMVHSTALTAVRLEAPADAAWWRVRAIGAEASDWVRLDTAVASY